MRHLLLLLSLILLPGIAHAEKRVALVIGNSKYKHAGELTNPKNDAAGMTAALKKVGFQVLGGVDLDKAAFDKAIKEFAEALSGADVGLFFYAGHGLQVAGQNYLVPVDAELTSATALEFEMVRLDVVHRVMERSAATNVLFLDACRNNPLARNLARALGTRSAEVGRGLAPVESGSGTLISFSTQPGNVALDGEGRNSPFASALLKYIANSSDDLSVVLIQVRNDVMNATQRKQVPWEHSALTGRFYFKRPDRSAEPPAIPPARLAEASDAWSATKETRDIALLERFIARYKETFYAELARSRIGELKKVAVTGVSTAATNRVGPAPVTACDELAAADYDRLARARVVYAKDMRPADAVNACREAVKQYPDEVRFQFQLARALVIAGEQREGLGLHEKAAAAGYAAANLPLARLYEEGKVVAKDLAKARQYIERGVSGGNTSALVELAKYYREGLGVPRDLSATIGYLRKAVEQGSAVGMNELGWHYRDGVGVDRNEKEALVWFQKAADLGNLWAMRNIGNLYERGQGVAKDCAKAREWYGKAAVSDHTDARKLLAELSNRCR
jgi:uncharacterized protein